MLPLVSTKTPQTNAQLSILLSILTLEHFNTNYEGRDHYLTEIIS